MMPRISSPGAHGGDATAVALELGLDRSAIIDLSMSMNPVAPDVEPVLRDRLDAIRDYPNSAVAHAALATALGVEAGRLVLTNGGAEAIALVAAEQSVGRVEDPEFSLYRRHLGDVRDDAPLWRSNPSNPLGRLAPTSAEHVAVPGVWDEAFYPLATGRWTDRSLDRPGVWRLGSLTKLWSCPGLRLGSAIAPDEAGAHAIRERQPQWSVNGLALACIEPLLEATDLGEWSRQVAVMRSEFTAALSALGFSVSETDANWVLVDEWARLREQLIEDRVLVRDCSSFGLPAMTRVAVPPLHETERVLRAFERVAAGA